MVIAFSAHHKFNIAEWVNFTALNGERYIDRLHCEFGDEFRSELGERKVELTFPYASERED